MRSDRARLGAVVAALLLAGGLALAAESRPPSDTVESRSRSSVSDFEPRPAPLRGAAPSPSPVVDGDELAEVGRLSHEHPDDERCFAPVERSRVIGDALLTFSAAGVAVHGIDEVEHRSEVAYDDVHMAWCQDPAEEPPPSTTTTTTTTLIPVEPERD